MPYYTSDQIRKAREMDLLTYLRLHEPGELVHVSGSEYCTREHDSLKISNGKWMWFSRGFGGATALDYLVKELMTFVEDLKNSDPLKAFEKTVMLAEKRGVPEEKLLKTKAEGDAYFAGGK